MTATAITAALSGSTKTPATAATGATAADPASLTTSGSTEAQDRFLKLLVAQMSNQDPMNPMDNAQMTSQLAQINTVTGIQQLNDTMKSVSTQMSAMQVLQAGGLVGHGVLVEGNRLAFSTDGATGAGAFELDGKAGSVQVQVLTPGGKVVDTVALGSLASGQHSFNVDAAAYPADTELRFQVVATNGANAVIATPLMQDKVMAVGGGANGLNLTLQASGLKAYSAVRSVL